MLLLVLMTLQNISRLEVPCLLCADNFVLISESKEGLYQHLNVYLGIWLDRNGKFNRAMNELTKKA